MSPAHNIMGAREHLRERRMWRVSPAFDIMSAIYGEWCRRVSIG